MGRAGDFGWEDDDEMSSKSSGPCCQVEGCLVDLQDEKVYNYRKKICTFHMQANVVFKRDEPGQEWRFCFQCGKLEHLELFDGHQRSCRTRLQLRRKSQQIAAAKQQQSGNSGKRSRGSSQQRSSAKRSRGSSHQGGSRSPVTQTSAWEEQQTQQLQTMQWQYGSTQQGDLVAQQPSLVSAWGCSADSCPGEVPPTPVAAAAGAQWQQRMGSLAAGIQGATSLLSSLQRTSTSLSAAGVTAMMPSVQMQPVKAEPMPAASAEAAGVGSCAAADLNTPAAISGHIAALSQQCQQLQARIESMDTATAAPAAGAGSRAAAAAPSTSFVTPSAGGAVWRERQAALPAAAPVLVPQQQPAAAPVLVPQQQPADLQRLGSWQSSTPSSRASGATAATVAPTASHMDLVELVVQQLEDSVTTAQADKLEAMLEQELRAAATLPPEHAKNSWATQLNQMIDGISSAISGSVLPQGTTAAAEGRAQLLQSPAAAAAAAQASAKGALTARPGAVSSQVQSPAGIIAPIAVVESMLDMRLVSLQQQLAQLQEMVHGLRGQFVM